MIQGGVKDMHPALCTHRNHGLPKLFSCLENLSKSDGNLKFAREATISDTMRRANHQITHSKYGRPHAGKDPVGAAFCTCQLKV